ncbi:MAG TPA: DUF3305 domain-containing protein [Burkholderiales bacterium]|nr:DUF3305 domain-containing protein [Burkholderiales bacterium]
MSEDSFPIAVIMQRDALDNRWASERWQAIGAVPDLDEGAVAQQIIFDAGRQSQALFRGFRIKLVRDEAHGYYLNVSTGEPKVFVLWRMIEDIAKPEYVTASYAEAARWMDGGETVDAVPMPIEMCDWVAQFVQQNYRPEELAKNKRKRERYR